jgi:hypothetical protein
MADDGPVPTPVIIADIDGTVAINDGHRGHFDWHKVGLDKPNEAVCELVKELCQWTEIIFMSGRMEQCREQTAAWIEQHIVARQWPANYSMHVENKLFMRADGDNRADDIVKRELYDAHIAGRYKVRFVLDDRDKVVRMWREDLGLTCLQVAPGDF